MKNQEAIEWLIQNRNLLFTLLAKLPDEPGIENLFRSLEEITLSAIHNQLRLNDNRHIFVVSIESQSNINDKIIHNYLSKAIKRFSSMDQVGWFDGSAAPSFHISAVPLLQEKEVTLRHLVSDIKFAREILNPFYDRVRVP